MFPIYAFPPLLAGSVIMALAIVSISYGRRDRLSLSFSAFCVSWAVVAWLTLAVQLTGSAGWARLTPGAVWLTYGAMSVYIAALCGGNRDSRVPVLGISPARWLMAMFVVGTISGALAAGTDWVVRGLRPVTTLGYSFDFAPTALLFHGPIGVLGALGLVLLYRSFRAEPSPAKRAFLRNNLIAMVAIAASAALFAIILPYFGLPTFAFAFDAFAIVAFFFFGVLANYQFRQVEELNEALEAKVEARTTQLRQAQAQLVQAEKMLTMGRLVAGVAHEINTPLGAMRSMQDTRSRATAKLLAQTRGDGEAPATARTQRALAQCDEVLENGLERIEGIVKQLKSFARLDEAELQTVDVQQSIDQALNLMGPELDGVEVIRKYACTGRLTCMSRQMNQVLSAVLLNAAQAAAHGGTITVHTEDLEGQVQIRVQDSGPGISPEHLPRVFDPGFTTKGVGVGTGMGLAIAYRVIEDHGGRIELSSTPPEGTEVRITLPLQPPDKPPA